MMKTLSSAGAAIFFGGIVVLFAAVLFDGRGEVDDTDALFAVATPTLEVSQPEWQHEVDVAMCVKSK